MTSWPANTSYWMDAIDGADSGPLEGTVEADVVCIGGGYTGLVSALCLKRSQPSLEVVLLEAHHVGFGASGRNAGMVLHDVHTESIRRHGPQVVRFTYEQAVGMLDFIAGFDCDLERNGYACIGLYPTHARMLESEHAEAAAVGASLLFSRECDIRSARFRCQLIYPRAAALHPGKYISALKRAARAAGVRIVEQSPVVHMRPDHEFAVYTERGEVRARHAILGLNAYMRKPRPRAVPLKSFIVLTEPLPPAVWDALGWSSRRGWSDARRIHYYARPVGDRILFGGRVRYDFRIATSEHDDAVYRSLRREMVRTFPTLAETRITHQWSGPVSVTWKQIPYIHSDKNMHYAVGYSGMGVTLATLCGHVLADRVLGRGDRWRDLLYARERPWPLPPEPFRYIGFSASYCAMRFLDRRDGTGQDMA